MPITAWRFNKEVAHDRVTAEINRDPGPLVEFGGASSWFSGRVEIDLCVDQWPSASKCKSFVVADLNNEPPIQSAGPGKPYRWAVCTHTLEDLHWPVPLLKAMPRVAEKGYISFPSLYQEVSMLHDSLGFVHHRWVYVVDSYGPSPVLVCYPKCNLLDATYLKAARERTAVYGCDCRGKELEVWWEGDLPFRVVELGRDIQDVRREYLELVSGKY